ncbi:hypothetical protein LXA43DRAFT_894988 [Ganoderma leucocontextum]|nr:hypothetical protein LXA43DRAFT_894988 [Ganoderma leucocontextum]
MPSPPPFSSASLPPIRRVRLILGPDPSRASSSSRESSPELTLSSSRPFSTRRRWVELGWDTDESDLTPLEDSTDEGESEIDLPESDDEDDGGDGAGTRLSIVIPRKTEKPPEKHRWQCATVRCANLLAHGSFFKNCDACRKRSHLLRKQEMKRDQLEDATPGNIMEHAIANAVRTAAKEDAPVTGKRKRYAADDAREADAGGERLMEMPPYQHFAALLDSMRSRFSQFKAVQMRYVQLKALTGTDSKPMVFNFDGEYSVVADPSGGSVDAVVNTVIRNVQSVLELRFQLAGVYSGPEDSAIASLSGAYVAKIPQLSKKEPIAATTGSDMVTPTEASTQADSGADVPLEVTMAGELHICVAWDRRHRFFPGQRIMVRFRLVG